MGVYLSTPNTEKISCDNVCKSFSYGASSMQGWRMTQEDAHNCVPDFDDTTDTALFAVYDGHGGSEVAQYCSVHLPDFIKAHSLYKEGKLGEALEQAFLDFDQHLLEPTVLNELKVLAGVDEDEEEDENEVAKTKSAVKSEAQMLCEEADMPLDDLLARYEGMGGIPPPRLLPKRKKGTVNSPMIKGKKSPNKTSAEQSESVNSNSSASGTEPASVEVESKGLLANGHAENENNLNREKEANENRQTDNPKVPLVNSGQKEGNHESLIYKKQDSSELQQPNVSTSDTLHVKKQENHETFDADSTTATNCSNNVDGKSSHEKKISASDHVTCSDGISSSSESSSLNENNEKKPDIVDSPASSSSVKDTGLGSSGVGSSSSAASTSISNSSSSGDSISSTSGDSSTTLPGSNSSLSCTSSTTECSSSSAGSSSTLIGSSSSAAGSTSSSGSSSKLDDCITSSSSCSSSSAGGSGSSAGGSGSSAGGSGSSAGGSGSSAGGSGSAAGGSGSSSHPANSSIDDDDYEEDILLDDEFDSDESEDDDVEFDSEDEEDEDDNEDEESTDDSEEEEQRKNFAKSFEQNAEPGFDSGCTAVVAAIRDKQIVVANVGDSRCVVSRGGKALDLSFDHKPEDKEERERIEGAGGKVTEDGRVNGGLNLSRAIGDHFYKKNTEKSAKEQMITALPDIQTTELTEEDEFMVIACDGIWNYMTSQEVVDFVKEKLKNPENKKRLSKVCEEMFDYCLAPNTSGDGTGCDNMTCVIVDFEKMWSSSQNKRTVSDLESSVEMENPPEKRCKVSEDAEVVLDT
ncbi:hypothetical protein FSP39_025155 [Pinctada imbricata]|uniref:protein-serine/threonine phosphatase n=1 Tax=Pinctada imbricata TaxID=66713 RepID=A0AA88Y1Q4_PINIB|nr:hypothetical protein FSP39_025155 [Pinctada imbricata]